VAIANDERTIEYPLCELRQQGVVTHNDGATVRTGSKPTPLWNCWIPFGGNPCNDPDRELHRIRKRQHCLSGHGPSFTLNAFRRRFDFAERRFEARVAIPGDTAIAKCSQLHKGRKVDNRDRNGSRRSMQQFRTTLLDRSIIQGDGFNELL